MNLLKRSELRYSSIAQTTSLIQLASPLLDDAVTQFFCFIAPPKYRIPAMAKNDGYIAISGEEEGITSKLQQKTSLVTRRVLEIIALVLGMATMLGIGYSLGVRKTSVVENSTIGMVPL